MVPTLDPRHRAPGSPARAAERSAYFFGFGGAAPGIFWLGAEAFALGAAGFFDFPLLSFMTMSSGVPFDAAGR